MKKKSDVLLILPPQWTGVSPYYALPILSGEIKKAGYDCSIRDLNIEFFNHILSSDYLSKCRLATQERLESLKIEYYSKMADVGAKKINDFKNLYIELQGNYEKNELYWDMVINNIQQAKDILRSKDKFYNPKNIAWAFDIIVKALEIASLPYFPSQILLQDFTNRNHKMTYESIDKAVENEEENPFINFYQQFLSCIHEQDYKLIGLSINSSSQVIAGLTLAKLLKNKLKNTHISIGGNFFTRVLDTLTKRPEFFQKYCNSLMYEEGERPIVELFAAINNNKDFKHVPNLLYLDRGKVTVNPPCESNHLNEQAQLDLSGLDLSQYLTPEIVFPIQGSRGCYWKKCTFCDHDFGANFCIKNVDKLIDEIKFLNKNFNIRHFEFIDEAISPSYLRKMSEAIIKNNLDISFFMYARTEKGFSKELLDLAYKAGLRMILWGIESGSNRIMKLINKGVDLDNRLQYLKNANDAGIWNYCFIFFGFPSETPDEAMLTINMIIDNKEIIHSIGQSLFTLGKHTRLRESPEKFGLIDLKNDEDELSSILHYKVKEGLSSKDAVKTAQLCYEICNRAYNSPLWFSIGFREFLQLYLDKFGLEYSKKYTSFNPNKAEKFKKTLK